MEPIFYLGILVALAGLAGALWSAAAYLRAGSPSGSRRIGGNPVGGAAICALVFAIGLGIVFLAVRGAFSADTEGRWHARFQIDGITYEGDLEVRRNAGPLTVTYADARGRHRAREQCTLRREGQRVTIRCRDARVIDGEGSYSSDDFDLAFANPTTLQGRIVSRNGVSTGSAVFARR